MRANIHCSSCSAVVPQLWRRTGARIGVFLSVYGQLHMGRHVRRLM